MAGIARVVLLFIQVRVKLRSRRERLSGLLELFDDPETSRLLADHLEHDRRRARLVSESPLARAPEGPSIPDVQRKIRLWLARQVSRLGGGSDSLCRPLA